MQGLSGVLELSLRNRSDEEAFGVAVVIRSRVLADPVRFEFSLGPGSSRQRSSELSFPKSDCMAGEARFELNVLVDAGDHGRHRFQGEFVLAVLAHAETRNEVNININKIIEQHGDRAGWGAINEVDLSNLIKLPDSVSANDLLTQQRPARYITVPLDYEGTIECPVITVRHRGANVEAASRCTLIEQEAGKRTLVVAASSLTLGRSREEADIFTWLFPRTEANDECSRRISSRQCRLTSASGGIVVESLSDVNPIHLDGQRIASRAMLPIDRECQLRFPADLSFTLKPLKAIQFDQDRLDSLSNLADGDLGDTWAWSATSGVGGWLIERADGLAAREAYVWLLTSIHGAAAQLPPLVAIQGICVLGRDGGDIRISGQGTSEQALGVDELSMLLPGDSLASFTREFCVSAAEQFLE